MISQVAICCDFFGEVFTQHIRDIYRNGKAIIHLKKEREKQYKDRFSLCFRSIASRAPYMHVLPHALLAAGNAVRQDLEVVLDTETLLKRSQLAAIFS
jgi:hypothetical protein